MLRRLPAPGLLLSIAAYFALWLLVPRAVFIPNTLNATADVLRGASGLWALALRVFGSTLEVLPTVAFMAVQVAIVYFFARLKLNWWQSLIALAGLLFTAWLVFYAALWDWGIMARMQRMPTIREQAFLLSVYFGPLKMVISLLLMLVAAAIGYTVSTAVRDKNLLLPVVMFAACIDFWTVHHGPVNTVMERAPEVATAVMAPIPKAGAVAFQPISMIGPGDFLFMALVFAVIHKLNMNPRRNYLSVFVAMTLGMLAVLYVEAVPFLPALTVLAVAVVATNWRQFKLTRDEKISTAVVAVILASTLPLVWFFLKPPAEPPASHSITAPVQPGSP